jgi:hypothetical protein
MKSSGSLRWYITNRALCYIIALYDWQIRKIESIIEKDQAIYTKTRKTRALIFYFRNNLTINEIVRSLYLVMSSGKPFNRQRLDSFMAAHLPLLTYDKNIMNQYAELCRLRSLGPLSINLKLALSVAEEIIADLKKEYHLE